MGDTVDKYQTIRVRQSTNQQLKRFNNFLSDRDNGRFYTQEEALLYLLNRLEQSDLQEYKQWLFNEDIQIRTKEQIKDELKKEKELNDSIMGLLCASCQRHVSEIVEAMG